VQSGIKAFLKLLYLYYYKLLLQLIKIRIENKFDHIMLNTINNNGTNVGGEYINSNLTATSQIHH